MPKDLIVVPISLHQDELEQRKSKIKKYLAAVWSAKYQHFFGEMIKSGYKVIKVIITDSLQRKSPYLRLQHNPPLSEIGARKKTKIIGRKFRIVLFRAFKAAAKEHSLTSEIKPAIEFQYWSAHETTYVANNISGAFLAKITESVADYNSSKSDKYAQCGKESALNLGNEIGIRNCSAWVEVVGSQIAQALEDKALALSKNLVVEECDVLLEWIVEASRKVNAILNLAYLGKTNSAIKYVIDNYQLFLRNIRCNVAIIPFRTNCYVYPNIHVSFTDENRVELYTSLNLKKNLQMYDRNFSRLSSLYDLCYQSPLPALLDDEKFNNSYTDYRDLASTCQNFGIILEAIATSALSDFASERPMYPVGTKSVVRIAIADTCYRQAIFRIQQAMAVARDHKTEDMTAQIMRNQFTIVSHWKYWILIYLKSFGAVGCNPELSKQERDSYYGALADRLNVDLRTLGDETLEFPPEESKSCSLTKSARKDHPIHKVPTITNKIRIANFFSDTEPPGFAIVKGEYLLLCMLWLYFSLQGSLPVKKTNKKFEYCYHNASEFFKTCNQRPREAWIKSYLIFNILLMMQIRAAFYASTELRDLRKEIAQDLINGFCTKTPVKDLKGTATIGTIDFGHYQMLNKWYSAWGYEPSNSDVVVLDLLGESLGKLCATFRAEIECCLKSVGLQHEDQKVSVINFT